MTARVARPLIVVTVAALGLAGCGGTGGKEKDPEDAGPLAAIFEEIYGDWDEETAAAQSMKVEEAVAACMAEEGFDYTPVDQSQGIVEMDDLDVEWGTPEFAEQYGYGITTDPWGSSEVTHEPDEWFDPNQEYVESMSQAEQEAYYAALWGNPVYDDEGETEYDWREHGCQGKAQHEVYEGGEATEDYADLEDEMTALWEQVETDPRRGEIDADWAACMADAGYTGYSKVGDPEEELHEQVNAIWEEGGPQGDDEQAWEAWDKQVQDRMKEITPREIELAVADTTCRTEVRFDSRYVEIQHEHEQRFVDAHKAELEAWAEAMRASRS